MGSQLPTPGSQGNPVRIPAPATSVRVEARQAGTFLIFETPDGPVEIPMGNDMMRALKVMETCQKLMATRSK